MNVIRKWINKLANRKQRKLNRQHKFPLKTYGSKGLKKALISYVYPDLSKEAPIRHCNQFEIQNAIECLQELGYQTDVIDFRSTVACNYTPYKLVFGFGEPYNKAVLSKKKDDSTKYICYLTGANPHFYTLAQAKRVKRVFQSKGKLPLIFRHDETGQMWVNAAVNSDALIVDGNEWTTSTYHQFHEIIYRLPVPTIAESTFDTITSPKRGFIWFAGAGAVAKGLDLVLEAMGLANNDFTLDICGHIKNEKDFFEIYAHELQRENIEFHGVIDANGEKMQALVQNNSFVILPSCSEGMASSVITCMSYGLIPIITKETGIDNLHGITITEATPAATLAAMNKAFALTDEDILNRSKVVIRETNKNHSRTAVKRKLRYYIETIIG